jgi:phosphoadenosine phosphosulfate reductase
LPNLYQTTAFGLTGLVTIDMLSKLPIIPASVDLIFLDTLHHFSETLNLVDRVRARYPSIKLHVFQPEGASTADEFTARYGSELWTTDDERYDYLAKVEPLQRANDSLNVRALLTGRRRSQGGARGELDVVEVDDDTGVVKVNPLANWSFEQVRAYVRDNDVPYNELLDRGYKSVGDWHSTQPVAEGEDERAGRWKGMAKTECGIHNKKSRYAQFLAEQEEKEKLEALKAAQETIQAAEVSIEAPLEVLSEVPVERAIEQPLVEHVEPPVEQSVEQPVKQPVEQPVKLPTVQLVEQPVEHLVIQPVAKPVVPSIVQSIIQPVAQQATAVLASC